MEIPYYLDIPFYLEIPSYGDSLLFGDSAGDSYGDSVGGPFLEMTILSFFGTPPGYPRGGGSGLDGLEAYPPSRNLS